MGDDVNRRTIVQNILYVILNYSFRLMSPFMPFITEELFQRLPKHPVHQSETIALAPYPEEVFLLVLLFS